MQPMPEAGTRQFSYPPRGFDRAEDFHEASKISASYPEQAFGPGAEVILGVPDALARLGRSSLATAGDALLLPRPQRCATDLVTLSHRRRSGLPPQPGPVTLDQLGTVLALCAAVVEGTASLRVCPSAGAMYPLDVFVVATAVDGLDTGCYAYDPYCHGLRSRGDEDAARFHAVSGTGAPLPPPAVTLAVVATFARSRAKYGLRGYRFALLEAGHIAQAAITTATALGLCTLPRGGFADRAVDRYLDLDGVERSCVYLIAIAAEPAP